MDKQQIIQKLLPNRKLSIHKLSATAYAPSNIALCKYWGKRDDSLNLPFTSSLSISLADKGAQTEISLNHSRADTILLNHEPVTTSSQFYNRVKNFLDLLMPARQTFFHINTVSSVPIAAGVASSACGFAALTLALNELCDWQLDPKTLSILARLGSGSACRSLWHGFVEWQAGEDSNGFDSYAQPLNIDWPDLQIGLLLLSSAPKPISSREAMERTVNTSPLYKAWLSQNQIDIQQLKQAIYSHNFTQFGRLAETNALGMHATMQTSWPPVCFSLPDTIAKRHHIWKLRENGLEVYFTQDAGPNLKLLFLKKNKSELKKNFPDMQIVSPFDYAAREERE